VDVVVLGGGEAGTYHARQLVKSKGRSEVSGRLLVVDRDPGCHAFADLQKDVVPVISEWLPFLQGWLRTAAAGDMLVPAPVAPHLTWEWLAGELGARFEAPPRGWGLPYEQPGPGMELYLSGAAWRCPATCVEPLHCPVLHGPRDWDLGEMIVERARLLGYEPAVFRCVHYASGVGAVQVRELLEARNRLRAMGPGMRVLVALSSRCHAAVGVLGLG
jgi:hypothetical protein